MPVTKPEGYSQTPLSKKLGIKEGQKCLIINTPQNYLDLLFPIPEGVKFTITPRDREYEFIHIFISTYSELDRHWDQLQDVLAKNGSLWISHPKGSSKLSKDINQNQIREYGLIKGLVDVKVCAIDHDWSGLKFMYRKKDR
ncbi:MAG: DUF3052 domain-containing protein [Cyclobacteriaceae bacterium]